MSENIYNKLKLKAIRSTPAVWVSRLAIYENVDPKSPAVIRDIHLARGLNIVWAEEPEDDETGQITGHSAGKTTFCRFLRYVLGENTFGKKVAMELIRAALPGGYVAAEIHVGDRTWAVRRPFGSGRMSFILEGATIEKLIEQRGRSVSQEDYCEKLGLEALIEEMSTAQVVQTSEPIKWAHILAWCTRDQEARFQSIHEWRSPRSESETPAFRFPRVAPLFVMRTALGLFLQDELQGEERLAELLREKDRLAKEIDKARIEPQWRVNQYDRQLRDRLSELLPDRTDIESAPFRSGNLLPDLDRMAADAARHAQDEINQIERERSEAQARIDDLGAQIQRHEEMLAQLETLFALDTTASGEVDQGLSQRQEQRKKYLELQDRSCPLGNVLIRDCHHVNVRQRALQREELQDAHAMEQAEGKRQEELERIEAEKRRVREAITHLEGERRELTTRRDALQAGVREKRVSLRDLQQAHDDLDEWLKILEGPDAGDKLNDLRRELDSVPAEIDRVERQLSDLLRQHDENRKQLALIFSGAVRSVLSSDGYDGRVTLDNRELAFSITHGPAMSGEAVETLAVLLCDLTSLVYSTVSDHARLPGFLVHDSPREADLGLSIYRSFLRFAASLQDAFGEPDNCPFQYILTTTTPPPEEFRNDELLKLRLSAAEPSTMLLRRNVGMDQAARPDLFGPVAEKQGDQ